MIGASSTVAWMMVVGLLVTAPLAAASGPVPEITPRLVLWLARRVSAASSACCWCIAAFDWARSASFSAITSLEGAIAAIVSVIAGGGLNLATALVLAIIAIGVATVAMAGGAGGPRPQEAAAPEKARAVQTRKAAFFGAATAIAFGFSIYGTAQAGVLGLPCSWPCYPPASPVSPSSSSRCYLARRSSSTGRPRRSSS